MDTNSSKETLEKKLSIVETTGERIQNSLESAMKDLTDYHNNGARGIIVDIAFFELYAKMESALDAYKKYNSRVVYNIEKQIDESRENDSTKDSSTIKGSISSVPRRSI